MMETNQPTFIPSRNPQRDDYIAYYEEGVTEYAMGGHINEIHSDGRITFVIGGTGTLKTVDGKFVTDDIEVGMD